RPPLGNLPCLLQIRTPTLLVSGKVAEPGAGQQATGEVVHLTGHAEAIDCGVDALVDEVRLIQGGAGQGEVIQGEIEDLGLVFFGPCESLPGPFADRLAVHNSRRKRLPGLTEEPTLPRRTFRLGQQEIAIPEAWHRVEPGIPRLPRGLPGLRVLEHLP